MCDTNTFKSTNTYVELVLLHFFYFCSRVSTPKDPKLVWILHVLIDQLCREEFDGYTIHVLQIEVGNP